ncbi:MAG: hypothetical protein IKJ05_05160 [Oscillospiraceae bacterium]|nr:hypothetical protein [Oscillospiraceae bacterium]
MTFEQIKSKLKLHKTLVISGVIVAAMSSMGIITNRFMLWNLGIMRLVISAICYFLCLASLASVFYGIHYIAAHTKCLKCKKQIELKSVLQMDSFRCPYCGNEKFDNDTVELWFK